MCYDIELNENTTATTTTIITARKKLVIEWFGCFFIKRNGVNPRAAKSAC
jgi:hypothetical protein